MRRTKLLVVLLGLFALGTPVWAQLDPKAQPFLDAYAASFENAKMPNAKETIETLDMTICMSLNVPEAPPETCTRTVADYAQRRMMSEVQGEYGFKMVYQKGKAQARSSSLGGKPVTLPRAEVMKLERTLKTMFEQFQDLQDGKWAQTDFDLSHYDGFVRYGNVIAGEQVTTTTTIPSFGMVAGDTQSAKVQLIFDREKTVIGMVFESPQSKTLSIPTNPKARNPMAWFMNATYYTLQGNKPVRMGTMHLKHLTLNAPLEDALFTLTPER